MITKVYAHILDEDRKINAQKFESAFYANPDLRNVKPPQEPEKPQTQTLDLVALVEQLQKSPELANTLPESRLKSQISKKSIFLSKSSIFVRFLLARIFTVTHKQLRPPLLSADGFVYGMQHNKKATNP